MKLIEIFRISGNKSNRELLDFKFLITVQYPYKSRGKSIKVIRVIKVIRILIYTCISAIKKTQFYICKYFDFKNVLLLLLISQIPCGSKGK